MYNIMVVEDDKDLAGEIVERLQSWGYHAFTPSDFTEIDKEFVQNKVQLVLMDVNLPKFDGFYWCRKIREISTVPIIFISSRDSNMDIIMAINMGADDYVQKPFNTDVLLAKITAQLRRCYDYKGGSENNVIEHRGLMLNTAEGKVFFKDENLELTRNELKILHLLLKEKEEIVSRNDIMKALWDDDQFINDNTLTVNINRLRAKLKEIGLEEFIQTKKGLGYVVR